MRIGDVSLLGLDMYDVLYANSSHDPLLYLPTSALLL